MPIAAPDPVDLSKLRDELEAAGLVYRALNIVGGNLTYPDGEGDQADLPDEARPIVDAHDATPRDKTFEAAEDVERLALVNERAQTDPAFAALAELALGKQGV